MSLAQKFRGFVGSKPAIALTSLLTLSSLLPFSNAQAQEPAVKLAPSAAATLTAHHNSTSPTSHPAFTLAASPLNSAGEYAKNNDGVGFWIMLPEGGRYTPKEAGEILVAQMAKRGVNAHSYGTNSPIGGEMKVIVFIGNDAYQNPMTKTSVFDLRSIIPQLDTIAKQLREQPRDPMVASTPGSVQPQ